MENSFTPPIKFEEVNLEIKLEQPETDELETIKTETDSKINVKLESYEQENGTDESKTFMQFEKIEIKREETEEGFSSNGILYSYLQKLNELSEVKDVCDVENDTKPSTSQDSWKCQVCRSDHKSEDELKAHITSTHTDPLDVNYFKCDLCPYGTEHLDKLAGHRSRHRLQQKKQQKTLDVSEEEEKTESESTTQKCGLCDVTYQTKSQLREHIASSHKDPQDSNRFKCTVCDYVTEYFHRLIQHKSYHDYSVDTKWYHCNNCSYRSKQKSNWEAHVCENEGSSEVDINKSPSESSTRSYFVQHTTTGSDTELKRYRCPLCNYTTNYKGWVKKHMLKHKGWDEGKIFKCHICEFLTKRKCSLQNHLKRH